ncbi:unnamed protein product, partial [Meganyctiphanes norvegica]
GASRVTKISVSSLPPRADTRGSNHRVTGTCHHSCNRPPPPINRPRQQPVITSGNGDQGPMEAQCYTGGLGGGSYACSPGQQERGPGDMVMVPGGAASQMGNHGLPHGTPIMAHRDCVGYDWSAINAHYNTTPMKEME